MAARTSTILERLQAPPEPRILGVSVKRAAGLLDVSPRTIKRMLADGRLHSQKTRGRRVIAYSSLQSLMSR